MIIANECGEERRFVINGNFTVLDAENGKVLAENDRSVKPYDFRLIELKKQVCEKLSQCHLFTDGTVFFEKISGIWK